MRAQYQAWYDENYEDPSFAGEGGALGQFGSRATLAEMPVTEISEEQMAAYKEYSDTAVIVISRCGTESADLSAGTLKLSEIEAGLVDKVATTFGKVIVLFNIDNIVEMGFWRNTTAFRPRPLSGRRVRSVWIPLEKCSPGR